MSLFSEAKPQWDAVGVEPSGAKKTAGWGSNEKPPAEWFNWLFNRNYKCIDELRTVVDALAVSSGAANVIVYGASSAGSDSYVINPTPAIIAYSAGMVVEVLVDVGNTGSANINVSAKTAKYIKKLTSVGKVALDTGDMVATGTYTLVYDGTDFILVNPTAIPTSLLTAAGDIIYGSGANTPARLGIGATGKSLVSNGSTPIYSYPAPTVMTASDIALASALTERQTTAYAGGYGPIYYIKNESGTTLITNAFNTATYAGCQHDIYISSPVGEVIIYLEVNSGSGLNLLKRFQVQGAGYYRVNFEVKNDTGGGGPWKAYIRNAILSGTPAIRTNSVITD